MKGLNRFTKILALVVTIGLLAGCAGTPRIAQRFYWPSLPDEPKIEWLGAYRNQHDLPKTGSQLFFEGIFGKEDEISFNRPTNAAADGNGLVYITDQLNHCVLVYDLKKNNVHRFGGSALEGVFQEPMGIDMDAVGNIYILDARAKKILIFDMAEKPAGAIDLTSLTKRPIGLAIDNERKRIVVCDVQEHKIVGVDFTGKQLFSVGKRGSDNGEFNLPVAVTILKNGTIAVADSLNARVQLFSPDGKYLSQFGKRGDNPGEFQMPKGIGRDSEDHIYVVDGKGNNFSIFSTQGDYLLTVGGAFSSAQKLAPGGFLLPFGIFIDKNNTIYVVDQLNFRFQVFQYMDERYLKEHPVEKTATPIK